MRLRCLFKAVQKALRDLLQGPAHGCVGRFLKRDPQVAVARELGIEWDAPEAGDFQARGLAPSGVEGTG